MDWESVIKLNNEIAVIQDLMASLLDVTNLSQTKEALSEFAVLKDRLASLKMERKAFLNDL
ncbi:MAG: hypothetical protein EOO61_09855 [Hymenobacter sp.]|nr:MAG: hypothetical protein EOO61_09855 [Hymenobacter sp.]